ncbi:hypothetical protein ABL78_0505 [Leptomonas seymouri]|uniref:Histone-binding protein RBBP4-like N-terminal domain-containing protein n=1 Tax=Leptomonas seymouri TaxID=5684 RepID=A0A0N0P8W9_LEPSE|nr:hypothetical protein ABL78_0505 [Leptomonas seymouri]|eukprot:KPI90429.1 hypothetical protein ABL78_0505 [Leptomonas seymouri]
MSSNDSLSGGEERAFLEASTPPPQKNDVDASSPPSVRPTATQITRSQALAQLRRGKVVDAAEAAAPFSNTALPSDSSSLEKFHSAAMSGVLDTQMKKSSEDTSSQVAGGDDAAAFAQPPETYCALGVSVGASGGGGGLGARGLGDGNVAPDGNNSAAPRRRHHDHSGDDDVISNDRHGIFTPLGNSKDGSSCAEGRDVIGDAPPARGVTGVTPASLRDPTRMRHAQDSRRLPATSLPRMLALQRAFETEARHLYEFCSTQVVEWPALAIEWITDRAFTDPERDYTLQYIAVGSQVHPSSRTANTVKVMEVAVPVPSTTDVMYGLYGDDDIHGAEPDDPELQEFVDPGKRFANVKGHFHCEQTLAMDAPVLKIRAMPAETNILAVKTGSGFVGVYNTVQEQRENSAGHTLPDALLRGHNRGGFGLSWNTLKPGYIASASDDGYVNYYDVSHRLTIDMQQQTAMDPELSGPETQPIERLVGHRDVVTDCSWHSSQSHLLASSSMDGDLRIWDIRMSAGSTTIHSAHQSGATAAQFHPVGAFQLASAGAEGIIQLWDIRRTADPVAQLSYHGKSVTGLQWSPSNETVLASYSDDGRVVIWDLAKTSLPLAYSVDEVAPPEVSFVHMGHVGRVTDVSWNGAKTEDWLLASTDTTNGFHVYRPMQKVVYDYRMLV